jgi:hypothetical protein
MKPFIVSWKNMLRELVNIISISIGLSKLGHYYTKASGSPSAKFNRSFPILWGPLIKWIPLIHNGGY